MQRLLACPVPELQPRRLETVGNVRPFHSFPALSGILLRKPHTHCSSTHKGCCFSGTEIVVVRSFSLSGPPLGRHCKSMFRRLIGLALKRLYASTRTRLRVRDWCWVAASLAGTAAVSLPFGFATGFLDANHAVKERSLVVQVSHLA